MQQLNIARHKIRAVYLVVIFATAAVAAMTDTGMVAIPGGIFVMGRNDGPPNERSLARCAIVQPHRLHPKPRASESREGAHQLSVSSVVLLAQRPGTRSLTCTP